MDAGSGIGWLAWRYHQVVEATGMIVGLNLRVEHAGRQFHIQVEDLGEARACFEVRLHEGGGILWRKQVGYQDILDQRLPRAEQDEAVRSSMEKMLHTAATAVARGKLP